MEINWLAVLVAAVASMVIGSVWYGPLFGKIWAEGMGFNKRSPEEQEKLKKGMGPAYAQQFVGSVITAVVLSCAIWAANVAWPETNGWETGLCVGIAMWLGFVLPVKYGDKLWGGKTFKFVAIEVAYYLIVLAVMGMILSVWSW